jgi:glycosyltransferase involved in cell wall biosynthesis
MMKASLKGASEKTVLMLCTAGLGGMRAVVEGYRDDGLFYRYPIRWVVTNCEGSLWQRLGVLARAYWSVCAMLLCGQVSAVHSHMAMRGSFWRKTLFNVTARGFGVPILVHLHGSEFKTFYAKQPRWRQRYIEREFERCHQVLVLSQSWAEFVRSISPSARVTILPNYVRMPTQSATVEASSGRVNLLFLGEIGVRKGIYDLIPAVAKALATVPGLKLQVGGNGEVEKARAATREKCVDSHVDFLGWVSSDLKIKAIQEAHIYILPSHNEGLPISILEAMSHGLPVIATRVGGIPELVRDGIDGLLVDAGDVEALAEAIVTLARSPRQRRAMGDAARARVSQHFSDASVLPLLYNVYDELLRVGRLPKTAPRPSP